MDAGTVPRNVRYLPMGEVAVDDALEGPDGPVRARIARARRYPLLELRRARLAVDAAYRLGADGVARVVFRTTVADSAAPSGGRLVGVLHAGDAARPALELLFTPVGDASRTWAEVQWRVSEGAVQDTLGVGRSWTPRPPGALLFTPGPLERAGASAPMTRVRFEPPGAFPCGDGGLDVSGLGEGLRSGGAVRTRWIDAAGHAAAWSRWERVPAAPPEVLWFHGPAVERAAVGQARGTLGPVR